MLNEKYVKNIAYARVRTQNLWLRNPFVIPTGPYENENTTTQTLLKMGRLNVSLLSYEFFLEIHCNNRHLLCNAPTKK